MRTFLQKAPHHIRNSEKQTAAVLLCGIPIPYQTYPLRKTSPNGRFLKSWSSLLKKIKKADGEKQTKPNTQIHPNDHLKPEEIYNQLGFSMGDLKLNKKIINIRLYVLKLLYISRQQLMIFTLN